MNHCHTHSLDPHMRKMGKAFALAVFINLAFTLIEAVFALMSHSSSLLADAGHNLGDVLGLGLAWGAHWLQMRKPVERFSYGYKRTSILAAFLNAVILIGTSVMIAVHAVEGLIHPSPIAEKIVIVVALVGIFMNGGTAMLFRHDKGDLNVKGAFLHLIYDALISLGVVVAAVVAFYTHWLWLDPIIGLLIVLAMLWGTWGLFRKSMDLILDAVPHAIDIVEVKQCLASWSGVKEVHDLHVWSLSTTEIALTAHLLVPSRYLTDQEYWDINQVLADRFGIHHITLQVERGECDAHHCHQDCGN